MRVVTELDRAGRRGRARPRRGGVRVRRRHRVLRAVPRHRPAHRGAGAGRRARHRVGRRRARVLDPAPAPEGRRGGAVAARRARRRACAKRCSTPRARPRRRSATPAPARSSSSPTTTGRFFFLEMNTRLQVEHPVTECTTGLDLVALQLDVADGGRLAENPPAHAGSCDRGPALRRGPGRAAGSRRAARCTASTSPASSAEFEVGAAPHGLRLDSGVADGTRVGVHYDPMLAKVIAWAPTRDAAAARRSAGALAPRTRPRRDDQPRPARERAAPRRVPRRRHRHRVLRPTTADVFAPLVDRRRGSSALAAALALDAAPRAPRARRAVRLAQRRRASRRRSRSASARCAGESTRDGLHGHDGVALVSAAPTEVVLDVDGVRRAFAVRRYGDDVYVDSADGGVRFAVAPRFVDPADQVAAGSLLAPMPGSVVRIAVAVGDRVSRGRTRPLARGDEDAAPDQRAGRRRRRPNCPSRSGSRSTSAPCSPSSNPRRSRGGPQ